MANESLKTNKSAFALVAITINIVPRISCKLSLARRVLRRSPRRPDAEFVSLDHTGFVRPSSSGTDSGHLICRFEIRENEKRNHDRRR